MIETHGNINKVIPPINETREWDGKIGPVTRVTYYISQFQISEDGTRELGMGKLDFPFCLQRN